ncbi:MAG: corrinoid protein [Candidatus Methanomethylicia archaeon]
MASLKTNLKQKVENALLSFDNDVIFNTVKELLSEGCDPLDIVNTLSNALKIVGEKFERGEIFLIHLVTIGEAVKKATSELLEPLIRMRGVKGRFLGRVVIGTVEGDIHDIGKNIVASMLFAAGFEVYDLGKDVPVEEFINKVRELKPEILALSALLTTTLPVQREVIEALKRDGLRNSVKVMVGGAPVTKRWAEEIGADGYGVDAVEAVMIAKNLVKTLKG